METEHGKMKTERYTKEDQPIFQIRKKYCTYVKSAAAQSQLLCLFLVQTRFSHKLVKDE